MQQNNKIAKYIRNKFSEIENKITPKSQNTFTLQNGFEGSEFISIIESVESILTIIKKTINLTKITNTGDAINNVIYGDVDMCVSALYYWNDKHPLFGLLSAVPFGLNQSQWMLWQINECARMAKPLEDRYNIKIIPLYATKPQFGFWSDIEINQTNDMKNVKIRAVGQMVDILKDPLIGADVHSNIPITDTLAAYNNKIINSIEHATLKDDIHLGLPNIIKHGYVGGWHETSTCVHLIIKKSVWNNMSDTVKNVLESHEYISGLEVINGGSEEALLYNELLANPNVNITRIPKSVMNDIKTVWNAKKTQLSYDQNCKKLLDSVDEYKVIMNKYNDDQAYVNQ